MPYPTSVDNGLVAPAILLDPASLAGAGGALAATNQISVLVYDLNTYVTVKDMRYRCSGSPTGNVQLGIYDANGNLVANTVSAAAATTTSFQIVNLASNVPLGSGRYYLAIWQSLGTDNYFRLTGMINIGRGQLLSGTFAGGLPASITLANLSNAVLPTIAAGVVGGI